MKIGIFGGSFNPIHIGHCILAEYIANFSDLDEVWLNVSPQNPLKQSADLADDKHRVNMLNIAIKDSKCLKMCDIEFSLPKPSYTITTLKTLKEKYPEHDFSLIIGADNWCNFKKWKDWETIIQNHDIWVYPRVGYDLVNKENYPNVKFINAPLIEISSTSIREMLKKGIDMNFFLPNGVLTYIHENKLYGING